MTRRKRFTRLVRDRAAKTGESYVAARRHFREPQPEEPTMPTTGTTSGGMRCSFCGKPQAEVTRLVTGPGVQICDTCVALSVQVVAPSDEDKARLLGVEIRAWDHVPVTQELESAVRGLIERQAAEIEARAGAASIVSNIDVGSFEDGIRVDIVTTRPGLVIGRRAAVIDSIRSGLRDLAQQPVYLNIVPAEDAVMTEPPSA